MNALRILVAEDNPINQKIVLRTLQKHTQDIVVVATGREAIDQLQQQDFDVILMDMEMPVMDGYEASTYIRNTLKKEVPIIAMTAHSLPGEAKKCIDAGATDYLSKPFDHNTLYDFVSEVVNNHQPIQYTNNVIHVQDLVDFSYVMELAGDKQDYVHQVLSIFMEHTPPGLKELEQLVATGDNWEKISSQAHFLKSSVGIVKVRDMHEKLQTIETLAKEQKDMPTVKKLLGEVTETFALAEEIIRNKMKESE